MSDTPQPLTDLPTLAQHLRTELDAKNKEFILIYAYNGTGKTRLSTAFKDLGKKVDENGEVLSRDTLYFNAFTEDLFRWNNDLENDRDRHLILNTDSTFFDELANFEVETRVRKYLELYADFAAEIDTGTWTVTFSREVTTGQGDDARTDEIEGIKVSRSEENIFIWCFFLVVVELALDKELDVFGWVEYIFIDDPISSLDDQNAAQVAIHLTQVFDGSENMPPVVVSTHHPLFHNVLWNELRGRKTKRYFLGYDEVNRTYSIRNTQSVPFFHHVAMLIRLYEEDKAGQIEKRHFNVLRAIAERTASFHGYRGFEECIDVGDQGTDARLRRRFLNLYSHGGYAHFEADGIQDSDKRYFRETLHGLLRQFAFNTKLFPGLIDAKKDGVATAEVSGENTEPT